MPVDAMFYMLKHIDVVAGQNKLQKAKVVREDYGVLVSVPSGELENEFFISSGERIVVQEFECSQQDHVGN